MKLSKSLYTRGLQCVKSLWLKKYRKDLLTPPDSSTEQIFAIGDKVGALACQLFPNGKEIPFNNTTFTEKIELTQKWFLEGIENIYEATFEYNGILIMVDILHIIDAKNKEVEIYEVKSSTEVKDVYLHDASIQCYVLNGLGYKVSNTNIVHINNEYVRGNELNIEELFSIIDVSTEILALQNEIPSNLKYFKKYLSNKTDEPKFDIGKHCTNPYPCDAMDYCWKHIPEYSIFNISRLRAEKKFNMYENGILGFEQITDISTFSTSQQVQILSEQKQEAIINKPEIRTFVNSLKYPIFHLDFETFQQAIPEWKGIRPYMQIPFQYSLHIEQKDGSLEHKEFLAKEGVDPRFELAKYLVKDIPTDVTVLAYNRGFEKGVIERLADEYKELSDTLMSIHGNIEDLMTPFQKKDYYTPKMEGSYSIKKVLPTLDPDMANAYKNLDLVSNGGDAMNTFPQLKNMNESERIKYRKALLEYCKLDTLAMVKVLAKLKRSII